MNKKIQYNVQNHISDIIKKFKKNIDNEKLISWILAILTYKYLSENVIKFMKAYNLSSELQKDEAIDNMQNKLIESLGYFIYPSNSISELITKADNKKIDAQTIKLAFENIIVLDSIENTNIFKDISDNLVGSSEDENGILEFIINEIAKITLELDSNFENSYSNISKFIIELYENITANKKRKISTPESVARILIGISQKDHKIKDIYDPVCEVGSILMESSKQSNVYGQQDNFNYCNIVIMNLLLQGWNLKKIYIKHGDIISNPGHMDFKFNSIVSNIVKCKQWKKENKYLLDPRFNEYGLLPGNKKAEYLYIEHMLFHLEQEGIMAILVSHGVLFRESVEGDIRKYIIKNKNYLDGIIGLPERILANTKIPTAIMVFKKDRNDNDDIMFIDASNEFQREKKRNILTNNEIYKIISTYNERKNISGYSKKISLEEIKDNNYNLNIPRYIKSTKENEIINTDKIKNRISDLDKELELLDNEIEQLLI